MRRSHTDCVQRPRRRSTSLSGYASRTPRYPIIRSRAPGPRARGWIKTGGDLSDLRRRSGQRAIRRLNSKLLSGEAAATHG
jgi:hypothetical protein